MNTSHTSGAPSSPDKPQALNPKTATREECEALFQTLTGHQLRLSPTPTPNFYEPFVTRLQADDSAMRQLSSCFGKDGLSKLLTLRSVAEGLNRYISELEKPGTAPWQRTISNARANTAASGWAAGS